MFVINQKLPCPQASQYKEQKTQKHASRNLHYTQYTKNKCNKLINNISLILKCTFFFKVSMQLVNTLEFKVAETAKGECDTFIEATLFLLSWDISAHNHEHAPVLPSAKNW